MIGKRKPNLHIITRTPGLEVSEVLKQLDQQFKILDQELFAKGLGDSLRRELGKEVQTHPFPDLPFL